MTKPHASSVVAWLHAKGAQDLRTDSRRVKANDAFIAWPGGVVDGRQFVAEALQVACCALVEADGWTGHTGLNDKVLAVSGLKQLTGDIAALFYAEPSKSVPVIAFTGTNGKTSSAWWLASLGDAGLIGTLGICTFASGQPSAALVPTGLTTPDPVLLQQTLKAFTDKGCKAVAIEASSIGLVEGRLNGTQIHTAVFTNFTQDHLDYHGSMQAYWQAKLSLFDWTGLKAVVINLDDPQGYVLQDHLAGKALEVWTVSTQHPSRLQAKNLVQTAVGLAFDLMEGDETHAVQTQLMGRYNVNNLLGVVAALRSLGEPLATIAAKLGDLQSVPGRLELIGVRSQLNVPLLVVDYAHTPDALSKALQTMRDAALARGGKLWVVFGCGGNRDATKRPLMGEVAHSLADHVVLTSDNPRDEDPKLILSQILPGIGEDKSVDVESDRRAAIDYVLSKAAHNDVVLIAGKGHEDYQEIKGQKLPFDDRVVARTALMLRAVSEIDDWHTKICTDTRALKAGEVFVALVGETHDAHHYLAEVAAKGAALAVVARGHVALGALQNLAMPLIEVDNTLHALGAIARKHRTDWGLAHQSSQVKPPIIAVTGSNGKTTLTQMIGSVLRAWQGDKALVTQGNLNNEIGVPQTLLRLMPHHTCAVIELGMNHEGEIARLAAMTQATVAVVNNAQREHQEFMGTVEAVAYENGAVIEALAGDGVAVFPRDEEFTNVWGKLSGARKAITFEGAHANNWGQIPIGLERSEKQLGSDPNWLAPVKAITPPAFTNGAWQVTVATPSGELSYQLHMAGRHNVKNSLAAVAACVAAGVPLAAISEGLTKFQAVKGRSNTSQITLAGRTLTLVDDTYNANPDSCLAAIDMLCDLPAPHLLVLGDMGEVGDQGPEFHAEVGRYAKAKNIEQILCLGELSKHLARESEGEWLSSIDALQAKTHAACARSNSVLVKGSRFMRMERVVQHLQTLSESASHAA